MEKIKIAVIGAGPAGLTAAYQLSKEKKFEIHLYEASSVVGGMSRSLKLWNQIVDLGPHRFFSSDPRVNKIWLEVIEREYVMVDRLTRIFYKNKFYYYPLKAFNALANLGIIEALICVLNYIFYKLFPLKDESGFENWITNRFGKRLYQIFFKTYTEKLWGIPCTELDSDFATQRIKKLSLYEAIKNALLQGKGNKHKTLVDQFAYPLYGTGYVYEKMLKKFHDNGGVSFFKNPIKRVFMKDKDLISGIELLNGEKIDYHHVISSMPLTLLVQQLDFVPEKIKIAAKNLKFRNTILVYLRVQGENLFPDQWLYVHSTELNMGRMTNFSNWSRTIQGNEKDTILVLEYWCYDVDQMWNEQDSKLIELASNEAYKTGLLGHSKVTDGYVYKVHRSYPVYNKGYKLNLGIVEEYLKGLRGLDVIGRYGSFKYNNQDHSILMGLLVAENLINDELTHNLWNINTDYEYQESSKITESGLVY